MSYFFAFFGFFATFFGVLSPRKTAKILYVIGQIINGNWIFVDFEEYEDRKSYRYLYVILIAFFFVTSIAFLLIMSFL